MGGFSSPVSSMLPPSQQPVNGSQNGLTNFIQSTENSLGTSGANTFNAGQSTFGTGQPILQTGVGTEQQGAAALGPVISYFSKLLGSNADLTSALAPQMDTISDQFNNIRQSIMANAPRTGGTASAFAEAPFQEAGQKGRIASEARGQAASGLTSAASTLGGIGASEAGAGVAESGLGLSESSLGLQQITEALQAGLAQRGQNITNNFANNFQTITQGLNNLI
jgi:hypothetical protein